MESKGGYIMDSLVDNRIDFSRQIEFDGLCSMGNNDKRSLNVIVGCGGIGFWLAIFLAMQGYYKFVLIDDQKIEPSNLNRLPVPPSWVGLYKVNALRKVIRTLRPVTEIVTFNGRMYEEGFEYINILNKNNDKQVWDCTDDARVQKALSNWCKDKISYRKIGYEGFKVGTYTDFNVWTTDDYAPGYRTSNACAVTSALAGVVGIMANILNLSQDIDLDMKEVLNGKKEKVVKSTGREAILPI